MGAQLSLKAAMPLAEILATCRKNVSNTGPWIRPDRQAWDVHGRPLTAPVTTSSTGEPGAVAGAALPCPVSAMQPDPLTPAEQLTDTGAFSDAFLSLVGRPLTQPLQQTTTYLGDEITTPLGRIFSLPCPASPPRSSVPASSQSQLGLASGRPLHAPTASSTSVPALSLASRPLWLLLQHVQALMKDWLFLRDHAGQDTGSDGWRSTSANHGFLYSPEYGPQCVAAVESLWWPRGIVGST